MARLNSELSPFVTRRDMLRVAGAGVLSLFWSNWLRLQVNRGLIDLDDVEEAAGILIGMLAGAPQRAAIFGGVPLPSRGHVKARVRKCVTMFLHGCEAKRPAR